MKLWKYERERVRIITKEGQEIKGLVDVYFDKDDSESKYDSIALKMNVNTIEIAENEIKSIEIIE